MTDVGDVLYREGDLDYDFVVILEGKVAVIEGYEGPEQQVVESTGRAGSSARSACSRARQPSSRRWSSSQERCSSCPWSGSESSCSRTPR